MRSSLSLRVLSPLVAVALVACSSLETRITRPEDQPTSMQLRIEVPQNSSGSSSASAVPGPSANVTIGDGTNTLNITAVRIVLDQVEFRRDSATGCVDADTQDDGDPCAELAVQPTVLELPVASEPVITNAVVVEPGTYEALEFDLHVAQNAQEVPQNLDLIGGSVLIQGSYNGSPLSEALYPVSGQVELELDSPIELETGFSSGMTLTVEVADWFQDSEGNVMDPSNAAAKDSATRAQVADRIMGSFSLEAGV